MLRCTPMEFCLSRTHRHVWQRCVQDADGDCAIPQQTGPQPCVLYCAGALWCCCVLTVGWNQQGPCHELLRPEGS
jgi:hypothetical protein